MTASNGLRYDASSNVKSINMGNNIHSFYIYADTQIDLTVSADDCNKLKFDGSVGANSIEDGLMIYDGSNRSATVLFGQNYIHHNISEKSTGTSMYFISNANGSATYLFTGTIAQIYAISYDLAGGTVADANPSEYTCETDTFTLTNPTREGYEFAGWTGTELDAASTSVTIAKGSYGHRSYTATWKKLLTNSDITVETIADQTYTGSIITPNITVKDGETDITDQCDIAITNNTNVGTADVTITAKATSSEYSGSTSTTFKIVYADGIGAQLAGYSLSLDGDIGVNFYMELDQSVIEDTGAYMHFTLPDNSTQKVYVNAGEGRTAAYKDTTLDPTKTYYVFKCNVAAKEMNDTISAKIVTTQNGQTKETTPPYTYSVKQYAEDLTARESENTVLCNLVDAMLYFGTVSQKAFGHNTETPANGGKSYTGAEWNYNSSFRIPISADEGIEYYGSSLMLETKVSERHYFKVTGNINDFTFTIDGKSVDPVQYDGDPDYWYIQSDQIKAEDLGKSFKIEVIKDTETIISYDYSPMDYVSLIFVKYDDENNEWHIQAKALYWYWKAAEAYRAAYPSQA